MQSTTSPTKEQIRSYMQERQKSIVPPPSPDQVKAILGWTMPRAARS